MRAFIAIDIPAEQSILRMQKAINGKVKLVEKENIHITLKFLGDIEEKSIEKIKRIVENCKTQKYFLSVKGVGFFPSEKYVKIIWLGVKDAGETERMMRCIDAHLSKIGFKKERSYVPHITVARAKGPIDIESLRVFQNVEFCKLEVKEVKIKKSTLTSKGPIYDDVAIISLH